MKKFDFNGKEVEMMTIGEFAKAVGRESQTLRKWEDLGYMPKTPFRDPASRRLFPVPLVKRVRALVKEEHVVQGVTISERFKEEVSKAFDEEIAVIMNEAA